MSKKTVKNFTYIDEHGILGSNFYWRKGKEIGMTEKQLAEVGLTNERVRVHKSIIPALQNVDNTLKEQGYRLYITEGYRSPELYRFVYKKMSELKGKDQSDRIFNLKDMPHATGRSVDATL